MAERESEGEAKIDGKKRQVTSEQQGKKREMEKVISFLSFGVEKYSSLANIL